MNCLRAITSRSVGGCWVLCAVLGISVAIRSVAAMPEREKTSSPEQTAQSLSGSAVAAYDLKEVSAFEVPEMVRNHFIMGESTQCRSGPDRRVSRYPEFRSAKPLYGYLQVGTTYGSRDPGLSYQYALDESNGTGQGYDRLYLDTNLNGDLTDDGHTQVRKDVPQAARSLPSSVKMIVCFDSVRIRIDPNDGPQHRLEVMPRLRIYKDPGIPPYLSFITTTAREGLIEIGDRKLKVFLGHYGGIAGWFDHPTTALHILPADRPIRTVPSWLGGQQLSTTYRQGDAFYRFSATPDGDKLFIRPYQGPLGTLEIGAGGRNVADVSAVGSLRSQDTALLISDELDSGGTKRVRSCRLPVGDYYPGLLNVSYGQLQFGVLRNSHLDGQPQARSLSQSEAGAIKIRANQPFVLDFSSKPQILFALPAKDHHVRLGENLYVKAVLIDPALDIMFRYIRQRQQLDPKVVIKRANGKIIAEGTMPFG